MRITFIFIGFHYSRTQRLSVQNTKIYHSKNFLFDLKWYEKDKSSSCSPSSLTRHRRENKNSSQVSGRESKVAEPYPVFITIMGFYRVFVDFALP